MSKSSWIRLGLGLGAFLLVGVGVLVGLVAFFPKDVAAREIERQVEAATERRLDIAGDFDFTLFPALGFSAEDVRLANPEGFPDEAPFLSAKRVVFAVALWPLLRRDVQIRRLHLDEPALDLVELSDGRANWEFPVKEDQPQLPSLRLEDMRISDGRLTFNGPDERPPLVLDDIDAQLAVDSLDDPVRAQGSFRYLNETLRGEATIADPRAVLSQGVTPLLVELDGAHVEATFDGRFETANGRLAGALTAQGPSVRRALAWLGAPLPPGPGFESYDVRGAFDLQGDTMRLDDGAYRLDAAAATGDLAIVTRRGRMNVAGRLFAPSLDVNPYMPAPRGGEAGVNADAAWPAAPIDLSGLRGMDANLDVTVGELKFQRMSFQNARLLLRLTGGLADAQLTQVSLYGGSGSARLVADARSNALRIAQELRVDNVQALPLLTDAIGFDRIEGRGRLSASLLGQGNSQAAIMRSLRGEAAFAFNDGAFKGVNLAQVARTIQAALSRSSVGPSAATDFAEFSASFAVADGVAVTENMQLLNPFLRLEGRGLIDIGRQTLDLRLVPRAVRSIEGQGGRADITGLGAPFRVSGSWARPQFRLDLEDAIRNEVREQARRALAGSELGDLGALFGLAGAPSAPTAPSAQTAEPAPSDDAAPEQADTAKAQSPEERAREALEGLFRRN